MAEVKPGDFVRDGGYAGEDMEIGFVLDLLDRDGDPCCVWADRTLEHWDMHAFQVRHVLTPLEGEERERALLAYMKALTAGKVSHDA